MKLNIFNLIKKNKDTFLIFIFSVVLFYLIINLSFSDIKDHLKHVVNINNDSSTYPPNFLYYFLANLFSGFTNNFQLLTFSAIFILALSVTFKYEVTKYIIRDFSNQKSIVITNNQIILFALSLLFFFSIPDHYSLLHLKHLYSSRFPPQVWHNSTTIFVFPFALLLFWKQYKFMTFNFINKKKQLLIISLLIIINVFIKPSFLFVFIPITGLFILNNFWKKGIKTMFIYALPSIIGGGLILLSYILIYHLQTGSMHSQNSGIYISAPFEIFFLWIPKWYLPISLLMSFIFPIIFFMLYTNFIKDKLVKYGLSILFLSILISAFIMEEGPRRTHGNFIWQNYIAVYIIELITTLFFISIYFLKNQNKIKLKVLKIIFALHILSGIAYIMKIIYTGDYS